MKYRKLVAHNESMSVQMQKNKLVDYKDADILTISESDHQIAVVLLAPLHLVFFKKKIQNGYFYKIIWKVFSELVLVAEACVDL